MRTVKPNCLSILPRCVEHRREHFLCVSVFGMVPLRDPPMLFSDQNLWKLLPLAAPEFAEAGIPKTRSEFLVVGAAYPPPGQVVSSITFGIRFAGIEKIARAHGRRVLKGTSLIAQEQLRRAPLEWTNAYGGPAYAANPRGIGHPSSADKDGLLPLPGIELPKHPWHLDPDQNQAAAFGVLDLTHPGRQAGAGTYDDAWLKNDFPGLPQDVDWTMFNIAPTDQRRVDPFVGNEAYDLAYLTEQHARVQGQLPGITARAFVQRKATPDAMVDLAMSLRTVIFMPDHDRAVLIWQGLCRSNSDDGSDISGVLVGAEYLGQPKPKSHYAEVLRARTESEDAVLVSLQDDQLTPSEFPFEGLIPQDLDLNQPPAPDSLEARLRRRGERQMQAARDEVQQHGLDPDKHGPPATMGPRPTIPPPHKLGEFMRKVDDEGRARIKEAKGQTAKMLDDLEREFEERGQDFAIIRRELSGEDNPPGPPRPLKPQHIETLTALSEVARAQGSRIAEVEEMLGDTALHARWEQTDQQLLSSYRANAHLMNSPHATGGRFAKRQQGWVAERLSKGQGLGGLDLTGADLRSFNLRGVNCDGAMLEGANLSSMALDGASFRAAVMAHANLADAFVRSCDFTLANLGRANLERLNAAGGIFQETNLWEARATGARMQGARFGQAQLYGAKLDGVDFTHASLKDAQFLETDLSGSVFDLAQIDEAQFIGCKLENARWRGCTGANVVFLNLRCPAADFSDAVLPQARFVGIVELAGASFERTTLTRAYFAQGSVLREANFSSAFLQRTDFTDCDFGGARFQRADLRGASLRKARLDSADFTGANLMDACLMNANAFGTRLIGCNLFAADLARLRTDSATRFDESLRKRARVHPRWQPSKNAS